MCLCWCICLYMIISGHTYNPPRTDLMFAFLTTYFLILEQYMICEGCWIGSPSFLSSGVLCATPTIMHPCKIDDLRAGREIGKSCFRCKRDTCHTCTLLPSQVLIQVFYRHIWWNSTYKYLLSVSLIIEIKWITSQYMPMWRESMEDLWVSEFT